VNDPSYAKFRKTPPDQTPAEKLSDTFAPRAVFLHRAGMAGSQPLFNGACAEQSSVTSPCESSAVAKHRSLPGIAVEQLQPARRRRTRS
jgi:hypothetical protein